MRVSRDFTTVATDNRQNIQKNDPPKSTGRKKRWKIVRFDVAKCVSVIRMSVGIPTVVRRNVTVTVICLSKSISVCLYRRAVVHHVVVHNLTTKLKKHDQSNLLKSSAELMQRSTTFAWNATFPWKAKSILWLRNPYASEYQKNRKIIHNTVSSRTPLYSWTTLAWCCCHHRYYHRGHLAQSKSCETKSFFSLLGHLYPVTHCSFVHCNTWFLAADRACRSRNGGIKSSGWWYKWRSDDKFKLLRLLWMLPGAC